MVNRPQDTPLVIPKDLKNRIKIAAAKEGRSMRSYIDRLVPKEP